MRVERNESCEGSCNGQIILDVTGGTVPYTGVSTNINSGIVFKPPTISNVFLPDLIKSFFSLSKDFSFRFFTTLENFSLDTNKALQ